MKNDGRFFTLMNPTITLRLGFASVRPKLSTVFSKDCPMPANPSELLQAVDEYVAARNRRQAFQRRLRGVDVAEYIAFPEMQRIVTAYPAKQSGTRHRTLARL